MNNNYKRIFLVALLLVAVLAIWARTATNTTSGKKFDLTQYHNVGNIWLRVSNYGFFGSGDDIQPQYPSLEYPGGSGADYLYQGALWFGAKKQRRDQTGKKLYWKNWPPTPENKETITEDHPDWNPGSTAVVDTLVTVGFDGDSDLYEFLPAYNPLESNTDEMAPYFDGNNSTDKMITSSTRRNRRGVDDDGDGLIDEDFPGYTFKLRDRNELPNVFGDLSGDYLAGLNPEEIAKINEGRNYEIWFPLGFMDLSDSGEDFLYGDIEHNFAGPVNDDNDNYIDEDGAPVSEQDFISYYYDYSPFGTSVNRDWGGSRAGNNHVPLKIKVRQMSYQWSYEYIKNLVYVEFDITNMNQEDTLYDCAMGIYMDSDVGPQSYGSEKAQDDLSGYVKGEGYEFAYTRDDDGDDGLVDGLVGARVCTPDPDMLEFACWYWSVGEGPGDTSPLDIGSAETYNEKYYLLTGKKPASAPDITDLRKNDDPNISEFEQVNPEDTRFLFGFYGAQPGTTDYADVTKRWNLAPGKTMKIVVALFPGDNLPDLKRSARWAKDIYGQAQDLTTVVLPDTFPHYNPPEPPEIPMMYASIEEDGKVIDLYWDNRSEYTVDTKTVSSALIGWQKINPNFDSYEYGVDYSNFPDEFKPNDANDNIAGRLNPFTGDRLRHDFQGYTLWGRSGSGSQEDWELINRWDKIETQTDLTDYVTNQAEGDSIYYGGYRGIDTGLPGFYSATDADTEYFRMNHLYQFEQVVVGDSLYGSPLYNSEAVWTQDLQDEADEIAYELGSSSTLLSMEARNAQALLFIHPDADVTDSLVFVELYDDALIPLAGHGGQTSNFNVFPSASEEALELLMKNRLSRRYYHQQIMNPPRGIEYYAAVTAFDRGIPSNDLDYLESGRDADANMKILFPGNTAKENMDDIYVVPNPYLGSSKFDGRRESDDKGDKSKRLWFVNIPKKCTIRIYTLAGDLVDTIEHNGAHNADIITISKAATQGITADGIHEWDILSRYDQIIASGVYLFSVKEKDSGDVKVGKFVIIK